MERGERRGITHGTGGFGIKLTSSMVRTSSERSSVQCCRGFFPGIFWDSPPVSDIWFPASCWNRLPADTEAASKDMRGRVESLMIVSVVQEFYRRVGENKVKNGGGGGMAVVRQRWRLRWRRKEGESESGWSVCRFYQKRERGWGRRMRLLGMTSCAASDATAGGNAKLKTCSSARASSQLHSSPSSSL